MEVRMLEKDMIFYNPGEEGTIFTLIAKNYVTPEMIEKTKDYLESETENSIKYVEERRAKPRLTF